MTMIGWRWCRKTKNENMWHPNEGEEVALRGPEEILEEIKDIDIEISKHLDTIGDMFNR